MGSLTVVVPEDPLTATNDLFIFVDNSNMCVCVCDACVLPLALVTCVVLCLPLLVRSHIGAQLSHSANPSAAVEGEPVPIVHVKYPELVRRVEADRVCRRRFVGGVMPDIVVRFWKKLGYSVRSGAQVCIVPPWSCVVSPCKLLNCFFFAVLPALRRTTLART